MASDRIRIYPGGTRLCYLLLLKKTVVVCTGIACLYLRVNVAPKSTPDVTVFIMVFPPLR
jgi:hypothetical protein